MSRARLYFREHTHDELVRPGGGAPITRAHGNFTIGHGFTDVDYTLTFDGESADGVITWMEDEDYFRFEDDVLVPYTERVYFRDLGLYIYSGGDGYLDLVADTDVRINSYPVRPIPVGELRANFGTDPATEFGYGTWSEETAVGMVLYDLTVGIGASGIDPRINFNGDTNDGVLRWMEAEDYFQFDDDIRLPGGENIVLDTSTGTKIGTAANQLLGFYNQTPVNQPDAVADATGAGDVVARLNELLARMRELGLIAT
jgi:uncharacterized protein YneR